MYPGNVWEGRPGGVKFNLPPPSDAKSGAQERWSACKPWPALCTKNPLQQAVTLHWTILQGTLKLELELMCVSNGYLKLGYSAQQNFILDGKLCKLEASVTISIMQVKSPFLQFLGSACDDLKKGDGEIFWQSCGHLDCCKSAQIGSKKTRDKINFRIDVERVKSTSQTLDCYSTLFMPQSIQSLVGRGRLLKTKKPDHSIE